jgi:hypothetical protein
MDSEQKAPEYQNISTINASRQLKTTYREQTLIGWDQIAKGRIATSWSRFINHENDTNKEKEQKYSTSETWGAKIITHMWKHILQLWQARNNTEHGETKQDKTNRQKAKLAKEIDKVKQMGQVLNPKDKTYIDIPVEELLLTTVSQMITWIRNAKMLQAIDNKRRAEERKTMNIRRYLIIPGRRDAQSRHHIPIRNPGMDISV